MELPGLIPANNDETRRGVTRPNTAASTANGVRNIGI